MQPYFLQKFDADKLAPAVCVLIEREGKILMIKRAKEDVAPGFWTPVTGSVESGEKIIEAVHREVKEEVGLTIEPLKELWQSPTRKGEFLLHWWWVRWLAGEVVPEPTEVENFKWLDVQEIFKLAPMFEDTIYFFKTIWQHRNEI